MKQLLFWASYLYLPFLLASVVVIARKRGAMRVLALFAAIAATVLAYARFVEPRILLVHHSSVKLEGALKGGSKIKVALFSDTHFGMFTHAVSMQRIVDRVNQEAPDAVMIAGDFLYHLSPESIPAALAPLAEVEAPIFAVLGNHDVGLPGPVYTQELSAALTELDVALLQNRARAVTLAGQQVLVAGISSLWEQQQDFRFSADLPEMPIIVLTHNPDTAHEAPADFEYDLMLAGHTHGGQVRVPGLFKKVIPTNYPFDRGLYRLEIGDRTRLVYVTPGTGMVGVPLRFNMAPRIDILTLMLPPARPRDLSRDVANID